MGIVIFLMFEGIMIDWEVREKKIGGEILCYVW